MNLTIQNFPRLRNQFHFLVLKFSQRHRRYAGERKRIIDEYNKVLSKQAYKLKNLSNEESLVLACMLKDFSTDEMLYCLDFTYPKLYRLVHAIRIKLKITKEPNLLDIDWHQVMG